MKSLCSFASLRLSVVFLILPLFAGCVSKSKARINAQQAYIAGQQSAMMTMQQNKTSVQVRGNVKNTVIPWTEGLTMAQAIVAAEYQGAHDPSSVIIVRNGTGTEIKAVELLHGHDEPLQPGDMIEIR
ncbi:MAG: hypothetical protein ACXWDN_04260 [Limisphaerales bacterium]